MVLLKYIYLNNECIKDFCTIGPSSLNKSFLINLDPKYVKLLRINLSHTNYDELEDIVKFIRRYTSIRICFDTEGAQIRTSVLKKGIKNLKLNNYYYYQIMRNLMTIYQ